MPYARPTLTTLVQQALQDITSASISADGFLRRSILRIMAICCAGFSYQHYDYQDYISVQSTPWGATGAQADGWGNLKGIARKGAGSAVITATFDAVAETDVPEGTLAARQDGVQYATTAAAVATSANIVTLTLKSTETGATSNADIGTQLTLVNGVPGVTANSGIVTGQVTAGTDNESDDDYKARYLLAYREPAQGGSLADYIGWAKAVSGVTRAWVVPAGQGAGSVVVYTMFDTANSASGGFPQGTNGVSTNETRDPTHIATGDQATVANAIFPDRPVTALVYSCAPIAQPINFTVSGLGSGATAANKALIQSALEDMFIRLSNVGGTLDPDTMSKYSPIQPDAWYQAIASVLGADTFAVPSPAAAITAAAGSLPVLGTVTVTA